MSNSRMPSNRQRNWRIASLSCLVFVLVLTHIPGEIMPPELHEHMMDKVEHMIAYGVTAVLFLLSLRDPVRFGVLSGGLLLLAGVGAFDELTQPLFHRTASIWDYAADVTGIVLACLVFLVGRRPKFQYGCVVELIRR